jgi:hypothetical protein
MQQPERRLALDKSPPRFGIPAAGDLGGLWQTLCYPYARGAVRAALPELALAGWWAKGQRSHVYALEGWMLDAATRRARLAFRAAADPEPRSADATRAALDSLRGKDSLMAALAIVPLDDPSVLREVCSIALREPTRQASRILSCREGDLPAIPEIPIFTGRAMVSGWRAVVLHQSGAVEVARALLSEAWAEVKYDEPELLALAAGPTRALGAWDLVPSLSVDHEPIVAWLARLAGAEWPTADVSNEVHAIRALNGIAVPVEVWREWESGSEAREVQLLEEGLSTERELWVGRFGQAVGAGQVEACCERALAWAYREAELWAEGVRERLLGRWDATAQANVIRHAEKALDGVRNGAGLSRFSRLMMRLQLAGAHAEATAFRKAIGSDHGEPTDQSFIDAAADGHSLEALARWRDAGMRPPPHVGEALARDGHFDEARDVLEEVLSTEGVRSLDDVELIGRTIVRMYPGDDVAYGLERAVADMRGGN